MIRIIKNIQYLKVNNNDLLDLNGVLNETFTEFLLCIESNFDSLILNDAAEVTVSGTTKEYSFSIKAEDEKTANMIQSVIDNCTK